MTADRVHWQWRDGAWHGFIVVAGHDVDVATISREARRWRINFTNPYFPASCSVTNGQELQAVKERVQRWLNDAAQHAEALA